MSNERRKIETADVARTDLGDNRTHPEWRENSHTLPFGDLSGDEFEVLCYLLLKAENPGDEIVYYGKSGDLGRDILHKRADGTSCLVQCKRYTRNIGIGQIREELAKLVVNVCNKSIPLMPDEVCFYVVPDLTNPAKDLIGDQSEWLKIAPNALEDFLGTSPSPELLSFAKSWWPLVPPQHDISLTSRCRAIPELLEEFFRVRTVIGASLRTED